MFILYVQLYQQNKKILYYIKKYYSILEALEANNIEMNFQCRKGYCGVCRTQLIWGNIQYLEQPLAYIKNFEILICCCIPTTNIHIKL